MNLFIKIKKTAAFRFYPLIERGYFAKVASGTSIENFLIRDLMIEKEYVDKTIQTIFLNHQPVDDISKTFLSENDSIAFSAAMPGLLGATMRKAGAYSVMRDTISHGAKYKKKKCSSENTGIEIWIFVKFFNLVVKDIGESLLKKGIWVEGHSLKEFFSDHMEFILEHILEIKLGNNVLSTLGLPEKIDSSGKVNLIIETV